MRRVRTTYRLAAAARARARLLVLVCAAFALAYGARIARDAARRREDTAAPRSPSTASTRTVRCARSGSAAGPARLRTTRRFCPRTARRRSRRSYRSARSRAVGARAPWLSPTRRARPRTGPTRHATRATRKHAGSVSSVFAFRAARRRRGRDGVRGDDEKNDTGAFAHESLFVRSTNGQGERDPRAALGPRARDRGPAARGLERGAEDSTRDARRATPILPPRRRRFRTRRLGVVPGFRFVSLLRVPRQPPWRARAGIRAGKK